MDITIKRPTPENMTQIRELLTRTIEDTFLTEGIENTYPNEQRDIVDKNMTDLEKDVSSNGQEAFFLLAEHEDAIVGIAKFSQANETIQKHASFETNDIPEVGTVYIDPAFQGKGIGSQIFTAILKELSQRKHKQFCLDSGFRKAQKFWIQKLGPPTQTLTDFWEKDSHHMMWLRDVEQTLESRT